jgi:dehydrogenase/reductase SDR family protein 1
LCFVLSVPGESTEFPGLAIAHLAADPNYINKTGKILLTADLAKEYKFKDLDGTMPSGFANLNKKSWFNTALDK